MKVCGTNVFVRVNSIEMCLCVYSCMGDEGLAVFPQGVDHRSIHHCNKPKGKRWIHIWHRCGVGVWCDVCVPVDSVCVIVSTVCV
jgi:hypothetical protein